MSKSRSNVLEFSDKPVKSSSLKKILEAGRWAPSFLNAQPWKFIIIKNKSLIERIIPTAAYGKFHTDPDIMICVAIDKKICHSAHRGIRGGVLGSHECMACIGMAVLSMALEATDLGIGSCILTPVQTEMEKLVKLPKSEVIVALLGIGYEKKGSFRVPKERRPLSRIVSYYGK